VFVPDTDALAVSANVCPFNVNAPALMVNPAANVCNPVHVGTIACDSAGAASDRMNVKATPLTAASPTLAVGLAPDGVPATAAVIWFVFLLIDHVTLVVSRNVSPLAFAKKLLVSDTVIRQTAGIGSRWP
jgi:hypothetical protein